MRLDRVLGCPRDHEIGLCITFWGRNIEQAANVPEIWGTSFLITFFRGLPKKNTVHGWGWCHIMSPKRNGDIGGSRNRWDELRWVFVIYAILVNISWNGCEKKARPGLWWCFFFFGRSRKKSRSNCWHKMGFSDVRSKVLFVAEWWNENYIELPTENSKHHPLEGIFWQRDVTFIALCYNEQLTEWHATHLLFIQRWIHEHSSLTKQERTHVTLDHSKTPTKLWEKGRI